MTWRQLLATWLTLTVILYPVTNGHYTDWPTWERLLASTIKAAGTILVVWGLLATWAWAN